MEISIFYQYAGGAFFFTHFCLACARHLFERLYCPCSLCASTWIRSSRFGLEAFAEGDAEVGAVEAADRIGAAHLDLGQCIGLAHEGVEVSAGPAWSRHAWSSWPSTAAGCRR
jgi:hypothetical protein